MAEQDRARLEAALEVLEALEPREREIVMAYAQGTADAMHRLREQASADT